MFQSILYTSSGRDVTKDVYIEILQMATNQHTDVKILSFKNSCSVHGQWLFNVQQAKTTDEVEPT